MEDIGLFKQAWMWLQSKKDCYSVVRTAAGCFRDKIAICIERHWPIVCCGCAKLGKGLFILFRYWKDCLVRGCRSFVGLGSAALLVIMWSCFLSLTSMSCLVYVLLSMGAAGAAVQYLGCTPGLFIVGLFAILVLWMYANFWITGVLFIVGGYLFSLNHARLVVLMATIYAMYCVKVRVGYLGVGLSINLAFLSNDLMNYLLQWCDNLSERTHVEDYKESESFTEDDFSTDYESSVPVDEPEKVHACKSKTFSDAASTSSVVTKQKEPPVKQVIREDGDSLIEMKRILDSADHYEALGVSRQKKIDAVLLKKEYRKKAMLVHPDKNMGSSLASESFKKLQCAYEVLFDAVKKRDYDEQLRKEESKSVMQRSVSTSNQDSSNYCAEESRRIHCTKCGNSHIWICTNRTKAKARWCQDCCQYHQAKDGDGRVEYKGSLIFNRPQKAEIPRAFVCAKGKIFDVSEWLYVRCYGRSVTKSSLKKDKEITKLKQKHANEITSLKEEMMEIMREEMCFFFSQMVKNNPGLNFHDIQGCVGSNIPSPVDASSARAMRGQNLPHSSGSTHVPSLEKENTGDAIGYGGHKSI